MISAIQWEAHLLILVSNTVFFTNKIFFICVCRIKDAVNWIISKNAVIHFWHYSYHLIVALFSEQTNLKKKKLLVFVQTYQKKARGSIYGNVTWQWPKKERMFLYGNVTWQRRERLRIKVAISSSKNILQTSFTKINHFFRYQHSISITHGLQHYCFWGQANLYRLCDYGDFGNFQDLFGWISWSKIDSKYLDVKLKVFKREDNRDFCLVQNLTMGGANFNQFMRLRNQLVIAAEQFAREEHLSQCWHLQCPKTWINNSNWLTRKICFTLLRLKEGQSWRFFCASMVNW